MPRLSSLNWPLSIDRVATVSVPGEPTSLDAEEAAAIASRQGIQAVAAKDVAEALGLLPMKTMSPPAS